jgi:hypothetical protein
MDAALGKGSAVRATLFPATLFPQQTCGLTGDDLAVGESAERQWRVAIGYLQWPTFS